MKKLHSVIFVTLLVGLIANTALASDSEFFPYSPTLWGDESGKVIASFPGEPEVTKLRGPFNEITIANFVQNVGDGVVLYEVALMPTVGVEDVSERYKLDFFISSSYSVRGDNIVDEIEKSWSVMPGGVEKIHYNYSYFFEEVLILKQGVAAFSGNTMVNLNVRISNVDIERVRESVDFFLKSFFFVR